MVKKRKEREVEARKREDEELEERLKRDREELEKRFKDEESSKKRQLTDVQEANARLMEEKRGPVIAGDEGITIALPKRKPPKNLAS